MVTIRFASNTIYLKLYIGSSERALRGYSLGGDRLGWGHTRYYTKLQKTTQRPKTHYEDIKHYTKIQKTKQASLSSMYKLRYNMKTTYTN